jgi:hypothetical protein
VTELETLVSSVREDFNIYPEERSSVFGPSSSSTMCRAMREEA